VLSQGISHGTEVFYIASVAVLISILAHGVTDHAGAEWIARRAERESGRRAEVPA
jgi:hypothetical protein